VTLTSGRSQYRLISYAEYNNCRRHPTTKRREEYPLVELHVPSVPNPVPGHRAAGANT